MVSSCEVRNVYATSEKHLLNEVLVWCPEERSARWAEVACLQRKLVQQQGQGIQPDSCIGSGKCAEEDGLIQAQQQRIHRGSCLQPQPVGLRNYALFRDNQLENNLLLCCRHVSTLSLQSVSSFLTPRLVSFEADSAPSTLSWTLKPHACKRGSGLHMG